MEAHERVLHELLKMGEMLLGCGAEINRVEDTMTRLGRAYGAKRVDIFVITSDIVLTVLFDDGAELTQTRRISGSPATDFAKLEALNALSRKVCAAPVSAAELHEALCAIDEKRPSALRSYLGSVLTALGFTLFLGGGIADALFAGAVGAMVCWMQRKVMPVFRNGAFFQLLTGLLAGTVICLAGRIFGCVRGGQDVYRRDHAADPGRGADERGAGYAGRAHDLGLAAAGGIAAAGADAGHRVRQRDLSVWSVKVWH